jgi:poly-beta-hydroxyalkanoate depolymerase
MPVEVVRQAVLELPFGTLLHFKNGWTTRPAVLLVAPLSGHFATLLPKPPAPAGRP